jgi:glycosyltransferase involved in cell wall biosynthesis
MDRNATRMPKISIVTPTYNQAAFIEKTIRSVLDQGYPNLEYIIIDGGSTDGTVEIIKRYESRLAYWVSEKDRGQSAAINKGLSHCTGEIFNWVNSDDWLEPGALQRVGKTYANTPGCKAVYGRSMLLEESGLIWDQDVIEADHAKILSKGNAMHQPASFAQTALVRELGGVDETLHYTMDLDLWIKITARTKPVKIEEALTGILNHRGAKSFDPACDAKRRAEIDLVLARYDAPAVHRQLTYMFDYCRKTMTFPFSAIVCVFRHRAINRLRVFDAYASPDAFVSGLIPMAVADQQRFRDIMEEVYAYHADVRSMLPYRMVTWVLGCLRRRGVFG